MTSRSAPASQPPRGAFCPTPASGGVPDFGHPDGEAVALPEPRTPRECSDVDLLGHLIAGGRPLPFHLERARTALVRTGGLGGLAVADRVDLLDETPANDGSCPIEPAGDPRLSDADVTRILAALELGRRTAGRRPEVGRRLATAHDVYTHYRARLASASVEEFWVLGLDVRHRVLFDACVAKGSLTGVEVHPRDVFRPLIRAAAAATIFCHNHPSGDPSPSRQDMELTARLKDTGALCGIAVLDHVVVAAGGIVSFADRGWL